MNEPNDNLASSNDDSDYFGEEPDPFVLHLPVQSQCDICGFDLEVADQFVGFIGVEDDKLLMRKPFGPYWFTPLAHTPTTSERVMLCRDTRCETRLNQCSAFESATAHTDCFNLFRKFRSFAGNINSSRAGVGVSWRQPWESRACLGLRPWPTTLEGMKMASRACDLLILERLPLEIAQIIQSYCESHIIWRFASVSELVHSLSETAHSEPVSLSLSEIRAWDRGAPPLTSNEIKESIIRVTIDYRGLQKIERLSKLPAQDPFRSDALAYIILNHALCDGIIVNFKYGRARLWLPDTYSQPPVWDTPCPPRSLIESQFEHSPRLTTANLNECTGLTFFMGELYMDNTRLFGIHPHTSTSPTARETAHAITRRIEPRESKEITWIYVPFAPPDRLTAFGTRPSSTHLLESRCLFLLRTALAGDISIGPDYDSMLPEFTKSINSRSVLVHDIPEFGYTFSVLSLSDGDESIGIAPKLPSTEPPLDGGMPSLAPLNNVVSIEVFENPDTRYCRGVILEYGNGAQRALGQCRLGEDHHIVTHNPTHICTNDFVIDHTSQTLVVVIKDPNHAKIEHEGENWQCYPMDGILEFWFDHENTRIQTAIGGGESA